MIVVGGQKGLVRRSRFGWAQRMQSNNGMTVTLPAVIDNPKKAPMLRDLN